VADSFPRQSARTRNFTLGAPRSFTISPDGGTVVFLRSRSGIDPVTCLWTHDVRTGTERLICDPGDLVAPGAADDPVEKARRERVRERAGGIVAYATDEAVRLAAFTIAGVVHVADLDTGAVRVLPTATPAADPRPAPDGASVAYVCDGALRLSVLASGEDRVLADPAGEPGITFGLADFIAAEELGRTRGYWWAPDGSALLVARVDENPVQVWHIADPANPATTPAALRYPSAGTANALVTLHVVTTEGKLTVVDTGHVDFPYLINAHWPGNGGLPLTVVLSRDQRQLRLLTVDVASGTTSVLLTDTDASWVDVVSGVPATLADGRIVWAADQGGTRRLLTGPAQAGPGGQFAAVTPVELHVREVLGVDGETILFTASADDPASTAVWTAGPAGLRRVSPADGLHTGRQAGGTLVLASRDLTAPGQQVRVLRPDDDFEAANRIGSHAERPDLAQPAPRLSYSGGPSRCRTAILLPSWHEPGRGKLPVLCDPYGGPHAQRVLAACDAYLTPQWFAEQGFAVVIADGRGTPGRGST
jgi:dipeptidyl-peptidase 4